MKKIFFIIQCAIVLSTPFANAEEMLMVVPYPQEVLIEKGSFNVCGSAIRYDEAVDSMTVSLINRFAEQLALVTGSCSEVKAGKGQGINFIFDISMDEEEYMLSVKPRRIDIRASTLRGFNWAIQTLKQMLPHDIYADIQAGNVDWNVKCCRIHDAPRFSYRGLHLDEARHFFGVETVKDYIDVMEIHKLNTLHWHLTDDQGWRVQIKKYPLLTEIGSIRNETLVGRYRKSKEYDGKPYGKGMWYSHDEIREIVDYAASRGIVVIPEIDLPGHMQAALTAYPYLGCAEGPYEVRTIWGISEDVLCIGKESTMQFIKDVLEEICSLFPSEYVHIGGDECPKVQWQKCPHCQNKIKELGLVGVGKYSPEHFLQSYVTAEVEGFLAGLGRRLIGWDEILEGEIAPNATVMSWRGTRGGLEAVRLGHDVIMTPNDYFYLDYYQSPDKVNEPLACGVCVSVEKCYSFEPFTEDMTEEEKSHIIGVQANLWTEYIETQEHLEYMLLPRMTALSEVQWCIPENKSWERFLKNVKNSCIIYDKAGYNYARHILK